MDNFYSEVEAHGLVVPLRSPESSLQDGDLTDEFIVNYMHEMESSLPEYSNSQLTKFSDAMTDVTSIAREVTSNWNGVHDYPSGSPLMVSAFHLHEESTYSQSTQSSYATSSYATLDGNYAEEQILNSPNTVHSGSQVSDCLQHTPKESLYETALLRSSVDFSEDFAQALLLKSPVAHFEDSTQSALLRSPPDHFEDSTQSDLLRSPEYFFEDSAQASLLAVSSYPSSSHSQTLPADVLTGDIATIKRGARECQEPQKKRRGRKPKSEEEKAAALEKRRGNRNRVRVYEIRQQFEDKEMERKRINAINSKKHRDQQKQLQKEMEKQLADASIERDIMKQENEELKRNLDNTLRQLDDNISERDIMKQEKEDLHRKLNAALTQLATIQRQYGVRDLPV
ncbi:putative uncharacterized protein DDB_G0271982 [Palaemon carinicauda]|uniref:putative uncharacterized protein DDB_G0271982 n=1 Tax=Palaemon carinicauda TaxID=392227 RepID=UPI0035B68BB9